MIKMVSGIVVVVKTTNLKAKTCMDTGIWFHYLLIYKR